MELLEIILIIIGIVIIIVIFKIDTEMSSLGASILVGFIFGVITLVHFILTTFSYPCNMICIIIIILFVIILFSLNKT